MTIRSRLRTFERVWLRPLGRRLRPLTRRLWRPRSRVEELERRIAALEELVRELTGLAWLRLDDEAAGQATSGPVDQPVSREAA